MERRQCGPWAAVRAPLRPIIMNSKGHRSAGQCTTPATFSYTDAGTEHTDRSNQGWGHAKRGRKLRVCAMYDCNDINPVD